MPEKLFKAMKSPDLLIYLKENKMISSYFNITYIIAYCKDDVGFVSSKSFSKRKIVLLIVVTIEIIMT